jgi:hypothetical protein
MHLSADLLPYVSPVSPIALETHFTGNPSPYTTTKPVNISCSHLSRQAAMVPPAAPSLTCRWCPALSFVCCWCSAPSLVRRLVSCTFSLPRAPPGALLLLPSLHRPHRFIWRTKAELSAGNLIQKPIQSVQILYKPLYRQNNQL